MKWREASGFLCDKRIPIGLKGNFYRSVVVILTVLWFGVFGGCMG